MSTFKLRLASSISAQSQHDESTSERVPSSPLEGVPSFEIYSLQRSRSGELRCRICDRYFSSETGLYLERQHRIKLQGDESPLITSPCPVCLVSCPVPYHLIRAALHRYSQNSSIERFNVDGEWPRPCPECNTVLHSFQDENEHYSIMSKHNRAMHTIQAKSAADEWQRFCWPCDRYFALESELVQHLAECTSRLKYLTRTEGELLVAASSEGTELYHLFEACGVALDVNAGSSRISTIQSTSLSHSHVEDVVGTTLNTPLMRGGEEGASADQPTLRSLLKSQAEGLRRGNGKALPNTDDNGSGSLNSLRKEVVPVTNSLPPSSLSRVGEDVRGMIKRLSGKLRSLDSTASEGDTGQQLVHQRMPVHFADYESGRGHFSTQPRPFPSLTAPNYNLSSPRSSSSDPHSSRVEHLDRITPPSVPPRPPRLFPPAASTAPAIRHSTRPDTGKGLQILMQPRPSEADSTEFPPALPPRPLLGVSDQNPNLPEQADLDETDQDNSVEEESLPPYSSPILQNPPIPPVPDLPQGVSVPSVIINSRARPLPTPGPFCQTVRDSSPSPTPSAAATSQYECPLCFECGRELSNIPCGHVFCTSCLLELLKTDPHCPICRSSADGEDARKVLLT